MSMAIPQVLRWRTVFYREQASFMYSPSAWAISVSLVEIPYSLLSSLFFSAFFYPMVGYKNTGEAFFSYLLAEWMMMYCWVTLGQLMAAALPNVMVGNIVASLLGTFQLLFSGVFKLPGQMPPGWKWVSCVVICQHCSYPVSCHVFGCLAHPL